MKNPIDFKALVQMRELSAEAEKLVCAIGRFEKATAEPMLDIANMNHAWSEVWKQAEHLQDRLRYANAPGVAPR